MRARVYGLCFLASVSIAHPQSLDLRGRIVQGNGAPVPDASLELLLKGISAKSAADGSFLLDGKTALRPRAEAIAYRLDPDFLALDAPRALDLELAVRDVSGRERGRVSLRLEAGRRRIAWSEAVPPGLGAGLYFLGLRIDGQRSTHAFFRSGTGPSGTVFAPAQAGTQADAERAAAKRTAAIDSLRIRKTGFRDLVIPITSYTQGDLGDRVLSPSPDGGGVCARQHAERTSDGFDVLVCEALFDQPPRVHLPAPAAGAAYAGMTRDSFVTVAGERYPREGSAAGDPSDPEIRRHASALYEITIRNGKIAGFKPALLFAESLFLAPLAGKAYEGRISKRTSADRYELVPTLPIRMRILPEPMAGTNAAALPRLGTVIENLSRPVAGADGSCLPALSGYGAQSPFEAGAEIRMPVGRMPSMHAFGDDELVFEIYANGTSRGSLMSATWFFRPLDLARNAQAVSGAYAGVGHGTPGGIPMLTLSPAAGGGGECPAE